MALDEEPEKKRDPDDTWPEIIGSQEQQSGNLEPSDAALTSYIFDIAGRTTGIYDLRTPRTTYVFDSNGVLVGIIDAQEMRTNIPYVKSVQRPTGQDATRPLA